MAEDLYKTLGVERKANNDEIKAAYRKLAKNITPICTVPRHPPRKTGGGNVQKG
jgi:DnaJ-class molecular chaperone with C-terminal Zn finger domain